MELWWRIRGWTRLRLTSADCVSRLQTISREIRIVNIAFSDLLEAEFDVLQADVKRIRIRDTEKLEIVISGGFPRYLDGLRRWWILAAVVVLLGALTVFLPGRILFLQVEGNGAVPGKLILEHAAECGAHFGASTRKLRSEQVKNHLLWAIPELRWAGVNTDGCTATISVAERQSGQEQAGELPGDIVSVTDAVVSGILPQTGTAMVSPGQAVRQGQILISGSTELGITTRVDRAAGEVYGLTRRTVTAVLPRENRQREGTEQVIRKFSLQIGKKYVNFSNDSGILYGTCVKMRTVNYLTLPGGFQLPVALVTDTYQMCRMQTVSREMEQEALLMEARRHVCAQMRSGTILREDVHWTGDAMTVVFECREMIGAFRPGIYTEGDTNERENRERGAG